MVAEIAGPKRRGPTKKSTATVVAIASKKEVPSPPQPPPPPPPPPLPQKASLNESRVIAPSPTSQMPSIPSSSNEQLTSQPERIKPNMQKREMVLNKLAAQRNNGIPLDRNALLLSIRKGVKLQKIQTKDKSGLFVDKDLITDIKKQAKPSPSCTTIYKLQPIAAPPPPPAPTNSPIIADPQKRANILNKIAQNTKKPQAVDRAELLRSIQMGVSLRKTNINDRSGLCVDKQLISDIKQQPEAPLPCSISAYEYSKPDPCSLVYVPPPPTVVIIADPEKRANILNKFSNRSPTPVDRDALLRSIQTGVNLRKTKINDRSGLVVDDDLMSELKSRPETPCSINSLENHENSTLPRPSSISGFSSDIDNYLTPKQPNEFIKAASETPMPSSPNTVPSISVNPEKRALILNKLAARNASGLRVDRDAFLNSIKHGVRLRKTKTNDRSTANLIDYNNISETHSRPESPTSIWSLDSHGINFTASSSGCETDYYSPSSPRNSLNIPHVITVNDNPTNSDTESVISYTSLSALELQPNNKLNRARSSSGGLSTLKVSAEFDSANSSSTTSPNSTISSSKSYSSSNLSASSLEKKKSDFIFDERNLIVTKEDIKNDIPVGSARSKIDIFRNIENNEKSDKLLNLKSASPLPKTHSLAKLFETKDPISSQKIKSNIIEVKDSNTDKKETPKQNIKNEKPISNTKKLNTDQKPKIKTNSNLDDDSTFEKDITKTSLKAKKNSEKNPPPLPETEPPVLKKTSKIIFKSETSSTDNNKLNNKNINFKQDVSSNLNSNNSNVSFDKSNLEKKSFTNKNEENLNKKSSNLNISKKKNNLNNKDSSENSNSLSLNSKCIKYNDTARSIESQQSGESVWKSAAIQRHTNRKNSRN